MSDQGQSIDAVRVIDASVAAVAGVAASTTNLPCLACVLIDGNRALATDGLMLAEIELPVKRSVADAKRHGITPVDVERATLPAEFVTRVFAAAPLAIAWLTQSTDERVTAAFLGEGAGCVQTLSAPVMHTAPFPDTDRVKPKSDPLFGIHFSRSLLARALAVFDDVDACSGEDDMDGVTMLFRGPGSALELVARTRDGRRARVLAMPLYFEREAFVDVRDTRWARAREELDRLMAERPEDAELARLADLLAPEVIGQQKEGSV